MANNPYSPPTTDVADQLDEPVRGRPRTVIAGTAILALVSAYALIGIFTNYDFAGRLEAFRGQSALLQALVFLPVLLPLMQIIAAEFTFLRRRWARVTLVVFFVWTLLSIGAGAYTFLSIRQGTFPELVRVFTLTWTLFLVRAIALGLLFTPSANAWFRARAVR